MLRPTAYLASSTEFHDSSVEVLILDDLAGLGSRMGDWCEESRFSIGVRKQHIDLIGCLSTLKSLHISLGELDDEALYRIGKLQTLRKVSIVQNSGRTSPAGWLQLTKLSRLEFLRRPVQIDFGRVRSR